MCFKPFLETLVKISKKWYYFFIVKETPLGLHCSTPVSLYRSGLQQENKCISFLVVHFFYSPYKPYIRLVSYSGIYLPSECLKSKIRGFSWPLAWYKLKTFSNCFPADGKGVNHQNYTTHEKRRIISLPLQYLSWHWFCDW